MLTIRKDQWKYFEDLSFQSYLDEMVDHIKEFTPQHFNNIGKENVKQIVDLGISRAAAYDLTYHSTVKFYLELMFMFGTDFDTDPQYPWINEILNEGADWNQVERADEIHEKTMIYHDTVIGTKFEYEIKALQNIIRVPFKEFQELNTETPREIFNKIKNIYPEKWNYLGEPLLDKLLRQSVIKARNYMINNDAGVAVSFALMFSLGHGCFNDLQFPWISNTVNKTLHPDPGEKIQQLYSKMMIFFKKTLESLISDKLNA